MVFYEILWVIKILKYTSILENIVIPNLVTKLFFFYLTTEYDSYNIIMVTFTVTEIKKVSYRKNLRELHFSGISKE